MANTTTVYQNSKIEDYKYNPPKDPLGLGEEVEAAEARSDLAEVGVGRLEAVVEEANDLAVEAEGRKPSLEVGAGEQGKPLQVEVELAAPTKL